MAIVLVTLVLVVCALIRYSHYSKQLLENGKLLVQHSKILLSASDKITAPTTAPADTKMTAAPSEVPAALSSFESTPAKIEEESTRQPTEASSSTTETVEDIMMQRKAKVKEVSINSCT